MSSRISGLGLKGIATGVLTMHSKAFAVDDVHLPVGGFFRYRKSGERHAFDGQLIHAMQHACDTGSYESWKKYSALVASQDPINLRDLLDFKSLYEPIEIDRVDPSLASANVWCHPVFRLAHLAQRRMKHCQLR